ncbi:MAG: SDR family NAD(P)-dependent oxidoreductase, partial [Acidobacteriota bacterium]
MKINLQEVIEKIQKGNLSEKQEISILAELHRTIRTNKNRQNNLVLYSTPYWKREELSPLHSSVTSQTLIVLNFSSLSLDQSPLIAELEKGLQIKRRIEIQKTEEFFIKFASQLESEKTLGIESSAAVLKDLAVQKACFLIIENKPSSKENVADQKHHDNRELAFIGKLLFTFSVVKQLFNVNPKANIQYLNLSDNSRDILSLSGTLTGLLKTLVLENANHAAKSIWVENLMEPFPYLGESICAEIHNMKAGSYEEVLLEPGIRQVKRFQEWQNSENKIEPVPNVFQEDDVILITGGLGGLGRIITTKLVDSYKTKLILSGRSLKSELNSEIQAFLKLYTENIIYLQADISKRNQVQILLKEAKQYYGKIDGIIHAAGIIEDQWLVHKPLESIRRVLEAKILGAYYLDYYTSKEALHYFIHFSSIASYRGSVGQSDYSCANSFLDHFSQARQFLRSKGIRQGKTVSIDWPLWNDGGMRQSANMIQHMERHTGITPLKREEGIYALETILAHQEGQVMVTSGDHEKIREWFLGSRQKSSQKNVQTLHNSTLNKLQQHFKEMMAQILKLDPEEIQAENSLSEYGFDSISLTEFSHKITDAYEFMRLEPSVFLDHPTLEDLCDFLFAKYAAAFSNPGQEYDIEKVLKKENEFDLEPLENSIKIKEEQPQQNTEIDSENIAIIGIGGRFPEAKNITEFWCNLLQDKSCIREIPKQRWDWRQYYGDPKAENNKTDCYHGSFIEDIDCFDSLHFDISPREAE